LQASRRNLPTGEAVRVNDSRVGTLVAAEQPALGFPEQKSHDPGMPCTCLREESDGNSSDCYQTPVRRSQ